MTILYRTDGAWGAGKGANLVPAEVDENFYDVDQRIEYLQDNPPEAITPVAINISGGLFTMQMSDGSTLGPIVMTYPVPQWRGDWMPATPYAEMDFIIAPDNGFGAVMVSHTSAATFDWAAVDTVSGLPLYQKLVGAEGTTAALGDLTDVAITSPADADFFMYDAATSRWVNATAAEAAALLPNFEGDTGAGGTPGMVPAPAAGDAAADKFLGAGGAWITPTVVAVLPTAAAGEVLGNATASPAAAVPATLSAIIDRALGSAAGSMLYRDASLWTVQRPRYVLSCFAPGTPAASQLLLLHRLSKAVTIPANFGAYLGHASMARGTANATASTAIDVQKATSAAPGTFSSVGTITIAAGAMVGTFASAGGAAITFAQGDSIALVAPASPDATFADFACSLAGFET